MTKLQKVNGLVSTIIPVFNRPEMLKDAVESVLDQDYRPIEIIIVDDGSTDNTSEVANLFCSEFRFIKLVQIENSGPGLAREAGRQIARGEYIQYLDSDDLLMPTKFSKQVAQLAKHSESGTCYCKTNILICTENRIIENWKRTGEAIDHSMPSMLASRWWGTSTPLYRRAVLDAAGPWTALVNEEDWEYDCRVACTNSKLSYVPEALSLQRQHESFRASDEGSTNHDKLRSRVIARQAIIGYALKNKFTRESDEFIILLKYSFLLLRQAAAEGLGDESKTLFLIVKKARVSLKVKTTQVRAYHIGALLIGWQNMGKLSMFVDGLRR